LSVGIQELQEERRTQPGIQSAMFLDLFTTQESENTEAILDDNNNYTVVRFADEVLSIVAICAPEALPAI
jgi:hypothetical protein